MRIVMKFGGTGVNSGDKVREVAQLIKTQKGLGNEVVVVVSAIRGMTDEILGIAGDIRDGRRVSIDEFMENARSSHSSILRNAITDQIILKKAESLIIQVLDEMENVLRGIILLAEVTPKTLDYLLSFGERLSTPVVSYALQNIGTPSEHLTGKEAGILTDSNFGDARPLMDTTKLRVGLKIAPMLANNIVPVVTGFIAADQHGNTTTIGRGGSDYTATLIASSIQAHEVWLWSDVNGLMTADPKIVEDAQVLKEVSFSEALEMALFGAKYIHPRSFYPVIEANIPIRVRNVLNVSHQGTIITTNPTKSSQKIVKSINAIRKTSLIDVSGGDMAGSPGTASRIFDVLARNKVNIIMISQSPSESSISIVVRKIDLDSATTALELNLLGKIIKSVNVKENVAIIAVVGSGMRGIKGVASKIFGAVARTNVNVIMIAQGSSELNLAFVVNDDDCEMTVRALHAEFELGANK